MELSTALVCLSVVFFAKVSKCVTFSFTLHEHDAREKNTRSNVYEDSFAVRKLCKYLK